MIFAVANTEAMGKGELIDHLDRAPFHPNRFIVGSIDKHGHECMEANGLEQYSNKREWPIDKGIGNFTDDGIFTVLGILEGLEQAESLRKTAMLDKPGVLTYKHEIDIE